MTSHDLPSTSAVVPHGAGALPDHPVRAALLDLLAEAGTVTATQAASRLGYSSGLCSFHLRQLARHGLIEEAPPTRGRVRPWRLAPASQATPEPPTPDAPADFTALGRDLEDESYQRWLSQRQRAPRDWQRDESFSAVAHLTPAEITELAADVRRLLARYGAPDREPGSAGTAPVAAIIRLFPLLDDDPGS